MASKYAGIVQDELRDLRGNAMQGAVVIVREVGTTTPATVYNNPVLIAEAAGGDALVNDGTTGLPAASGLLQPGLDANGNYTFYADADVSYDLRVLWNGLTFDYRVRPKVVDEAYTSTADLTAALAGTFAGTPAGVAATAVVTTGAQTIAGVKTFSSSPLLPGDASTDLQAVPKGQAQVLYATPTANNLAGLNAYIAANTAAGLPSTLRGQDYHIAGGSIEVDGTHLVLLGPGDKRQATITQETPNTPIIKQDNIAALAGGAADTIIQGVALAFDDEPTALTTQQYAFQARPNAAGDVADGSGIYYPTFRDVSILNAYVGIGVFTVGGASAMPLWGALFDNIHMSRIFHSALRLNGGNDAVATVGQPAVTIQHLSVINAGGTEMVSDGPCLDLKGIRGLVANTVNVEDWHNEVFASTGGGSHVVNGLRLERHRVTGGTPRVIYCGSGTFVFNGVDAQIIMKATTYARLFYVLGAKLRADALTIERDDANSTTANQLGAFMGDPTQSTIEVGGVTLTGTAFVEYLVSGWGPDLYCRTTVNGKAPVVDAFPVASATYRGRKFRTEGGAGVADTEKVCLKDAADAYAWVSLT